MDEGLPIIRGKRLVKGYQFIIMTTAQEKEFNVFGFTRSLRRGLIVALISIQMVAIAYLYLDKSRSEAKERARMEKQYDELLERVLPTVKRMNEVATKVDTVADRAGAAASKVDSISNAISNQKSR